MLPVWFEPLLKNTLSTCFTLSPTNVGNGEKFSHSTTRDVLEIKLQKPILWTLISNTIALINPSDNPFPKNPINHLNTMF